MAKYLLLKHYHGAPKGVNDVPMDRWSPSEIEAHIQYMQDFADRLRECSAAVVAAGGPDVARVIADGEELDDVADKLDALLDRSQLRARGPSRGPTQDVRCRASEGN